MAPAVVLQAKGHFERGTGAYRAGQLKQAAEHFKRAYDLAPSAELAFNLGHVFERIGEAGDAIAYYRTYLERSRLPDAERQAIEKRIQKLLALQTRQRAALIERPPAREALAAEAHAFFQRGTKLFRQAKFEAALIAFNEAQRFTKLPEVSYNMAVTCERLNRPAQAAQHYRDYLKTATDASDAEQVEARIQALQSR